MLNEMTELKEMHRSAFVSDFASSPAQEAEFELCFTRDPQLLRGYQKLRDGLYRQDRRFVGFRGSKGEDLADCNDPDNQLLIMHRDGQVYAGASIRISTPNRPVLFNLEQEIPVPKGKFYFSLKDELPELQLDRYAAVELDEIVIDSSLRVRKYTILMLQVAFQHVMRHNIRYVFGITDKIRTRLYRQCCESMEAGEMTILDQIDIPLRPSHENVKRQLLQIDLKKSYVTPDDPDASCLLHPTSQF